MPDLICSHSVSGFYSGDLSSHPSFIQRDGARDEDLKRQTLILLLFGGS